MPFYADSLNEFSITLLDLDRVAHDISLWTFRVDFRVSDDDAPVIQLALGDGLTINDGPNGILTGCLSGARAKNLLNGRSRRPVEVSLWRTDEAEPLLLALGQHHLTYVGKRDSNDTYA